MVLSLQETQVKKSIKSAQGQKRVYHTIRGYTGLRLRIRSENVEFQHLYTHPATIKCKEMTLGLYLALTFELARQAYNDNLSLLAQGIDPIAHRDNKRIEQTNSLNTTFQDVAHYWL
ncbi:integrase arm-type DNA-binding domain-containing protein [Psychrobacter sp. S1-30-MNA-CIBAN-0213]|uniref:integrase arm-type DNA-binding domain-containing protein n=1 Tax=unclassified Psychrobacter TaxID=196806 RepID=UPI00332F8ADE